MLLNKWNRWTIPGLFFAADDSGGGGGGDGDDADTDDDTGDQDDSDVGKVEFTPEQQTHLDDVIAKRLERARAKWTADTEAAAKKANEKAELDRLTEEKKWQELATTRETQLGEKEAERTALASALHDERIKHAVEITAAGLHFRDLGDAFRMIDLSTIEIDDDGQITGVTEALTVLAQAKPYLLEEEDDGTPPLGSPPGGKRRSKKNQVDKQELKRLSRI